MISVIYQGFSRAGAWNATELMTNIVHRIGMEITLSSLQYIFSTILRHTFGRKLEPDLTTGEKN